MRAAEMEAAGRVCGSVFSQDDDPGDEETISQLWKIITVSDSFVFCHSIRLSAAQKRCCVTPSQSGDEPTCFKLYIPRHVFSSTPESFHQ